jgi:hypothetical protein
MTRDEAKQLLGGYATGSLTEPERKALFEAALDDQELFEELAAEEGLKEILALPGAKQRLAAAVSEGLMATNAPEEKKKRAWWFFALAGVACVGLLVFLMMPTEAPVEVATFQGPQSAEVADAKSAKAPLPEPSNLSPALDKLARSEREAENKTTIEGEKAASSKPASAVKSAVAKRATSGTKTKQLPAPQPTVPPPAQQVANGFAGAQIAQAQIAGATTDTAQARTEVQVRGAPSAAPRRPDAPAVRVGALTYVVTGRGSLKITPSVSGSLAVTAGDKFLMEWDPVVADSTVEMPVPSGVDELQLRFTVSGSTPSVVRIPIRQ